MSDDALHCSHIKLHMCRAAGQSCCEVRACLYRGGVVRSLIVYQVWPRVVGVLDQLRPADTDAIFDTRFEHEQVDARACHTEHSAMKRCRQQHARTDRR